jgi:hypothetical protein
MEDYQERVITEAKELNVKVIALNEFLGSAQLFDLEDTDQDLLQAQYVAMRDYLDILNRRIERFV